MTEAKGWNNWLEKYNNDKYLQDICKKLIYFSDIKKQYTVLDIGTGRGRVAFEIFKQTKGKCKTVGIDAEQECINYCLNVKNQIGNPDNLDFILAELENLPFSDKSFDIIFSRSVIMHTLNKEKVISELSRVLKDNGKIVMFEGVHYDKLFRIYEMLDKNIENYEQYKTIEEKIRNDNDDPLTNYDIDTIPNCLKKFNFNYIKKINYNNYLHQILIKEYEETFKYLFYEKINIPRKYSFKDKMLKHMNKEEYEKYESTVKDNSNLKIAFLKNNYFYLTAYKNADFIQKSTTFIKMQILYFISFRFIKNNYFLNKFFGKIFSKINYIFEVIKAYTSEDSDFPELTNQILYIIFYIK